MSGKLIIARHQESEWNKLGLWTGSTNIGLTPHGFEESKAMGQLIADLHVDCAFASAQIRSLETLLCMEDGSTCIDVPITRTAALNERDYGDYTGKNKWEVEKEIGEKAFDEVRRGWDVPVPHGETLKMVYERAVPYYEKEIAPLVAAGKNVLVVAHGNSLRAVIKYIERVSDEGIADLEIPFEAVIIYDIDKEGHSTHKEVRTIEAKANV